MQTKHRSAFNFEEKTKNKKLPNSEFVREKLQLQYDPVYRINLGDSRSPYSNSNRNRQQHKYRRKTQQEIFDSTKSEIRNGKNIMIDWSKQTNFRSTIFPHINHQRSPINSAYNDTPKKINILSNLSKRNKTQANTDEISDISSKSNYLHDLLQQSQINKPKIRNLKKKPKVKVELSLSQMKIQTDEQIGQFLPQPKRFQTSTTQSQQKMFFKSNQKQIRQAMNWQTKIKDQPLLQIGCKITDDNKNQVFGREQQNKKRKRIAKIQQRILSKSKLTLLKSDLIKKFQQIRSNMNQEQQLNLQLRDKMPKSTIRGQTTAI